MTSAISCQGASTVRMSRLWAASSLRRRVSPVVEEDEVGPGLPAHVGEVPGAQLLGEEDGGGALMDEAVQLVLGEGDAAAGGGGRKKSSATRWRARATRSRPKRSWASCRRWRGSRRTGRRRS